MTFTLILPWSNCSVRWTAFPQSSSIHGTLHPSSFRSNNYLQLTFHSFHVNLPAILTCSMLLFFSLIAFISRSAPSSEISHTMDESCNNSTNLTICLFSNESTQFYLLSIHNVVRFGRKSFRISIPIMRAPSSLIGQPPSHHSWSCNGERWSIIIEQNCEKSSAWMEFPAMSRRRR